LQLDNRALKDEVVKLTQALSAIQKGYLQAGSSMVAIGRRPAMMPAQLPAQAAAQQQPPMGWLAAGRQQLH
jgi:hypothetical protein